MNLGDGTVYRNVYPILFKFLFFFFRLLGDHVITNIQMIHYHREFLLHRINILRISGFFKNDAIEPSLSFFFLLIIVIIIVNIHIIINNYSKTQNKKKKEKKV